MKRRVRISIRISITIGVGIAVPLRVTVMVTLRVRVRVRVRIMFSVSVHYMRGGVENTQRDCTAASCPSTQARTLTRLLAPHSQSYSQSLTHNRNDNHAHHRSCFQSIICYILHFEPVQATQPCQAPQP